MERSHILERLQGFISREVLEEEDIGLDESTPLLRYGIVNSITLVSLLAFIQEAFGIEVPAGELRPENLRDLGAVTELLLRLPAAGDSAAAGVQPSPRRTS